MDRQVREQGTRKMGVPHIAIQGTLRGVNLEMVPLIWISSMNVHTAPLLMNTARPDAKCVVDQEDLIFSHFSMLLLWNAFIFDS